MRTTLLFLAGTALVFSAGYFFIAPPLQTNAQDATATLGAPFADDAIDELADVENSSITLSVGADENRVGTRRGVVIKRKNSTDEYVIDDTSPHPIHSSTHVLHGGGDDLLGVDTHVNGAINVPMVGPNSRSPLHRKDAEMERQTRKLIALYSQKDSDVHRREVRADMTEHVAKHFDVRHQMRENEIAALEQRVRRLREAHDRRGKAKGDIVSLRVEQLLRSADGLGWGTSKIEASLPGPRHSTSSLNKNWPFPVRNSRVIGVNATADEGSIR